MRAFLIRFMLCFLVWPAARAGDFIQHSDGFFRGYLNRELYFQSWKPVRVPIRQTIVLIHGQGEHSGRYQNLVKALVPQGRAIYTFDMRGHGKSSGPRGHLHLWSEYREDIRIFLEKVRRARPWDRIILYGHSFGGFIVLDYALRNPFGLRGVISSAPRLNGVPVSPEQARAGRILNFVPLVSTLLPIPTMLDVDGLSRDPAVVAGYRADPLVHGVTSIRYLNEYKGALKFTMGNAAYFPLPLLMIHGTADRINTIGEAREFFSKVRVSDRKMIEYEGVFHEPHNDYGKELVFEDLSSWLTGRE